MKKFYRFANKNRKLGAILTLTVLLLPGLPAKSQDPLYSQWTNVQTYFNPAYVGVSPGLRTRFAYRKQWVKLPSDFRTFRFDMDIAAREIPGSGGLGIMFDSDNEGDGIIKRSQAGLTVAVRIPIMQNVISQFGILSSFIQKKIDWDRFVFTDQLDDKYGNIYQTSFAHPSDEQIIYPDFSTGALVKFVQPTWRHTEIIGTVGLAVHHIFEPNEAFLGEESPLPRKYVVTMDFIIQDQMNRGPHKKFRTAKGGFRFNPGFIYKYQGGMSTYQVGMNMHKFPIYIGLWYRNDKLEFLDYDALVALVGINIEFNDVSRMKMYYSFDIQLSDMMQATGGTHEIVIIFSFDEMRLFGNGSNKKHKLTGNYTARRVNHNPKALECPSF
ncbi:MAG: PorP/SprF family type IX secretion system membrane protein [Bacteroidetes bacterium]|nr:PorP/SprF family type IX secretion system membrane protein [Bacteroidota bacterium]